MGNEPLAAAQYAHKEIVMSMQFGEFRLNKYGVSALFGICVGVFSLIALECADDFLPAIVLAVLIFAAAVILLGRLPRGFAFIPLLMIVVAVPTALYGMHGALEDIGEVLLIVSAAFGFLYGIVNGLFCFSREKGDQRRITDER